MPENQMSLTDHSCVVVGVVAVHARLAKTQVKNESLPFTMSLAKKHRQSSLNISPRMAKGKQGKLLWDG